MSNFGETFNKQKEREPHIDYDDNAFVFFSNTILLCVIIPWSFYLIKKTLFPKDEFKKRFSGIAIDPFKIKGYQNYIEAQNDKNSHKRKSETRLNTGVIIQIIILVCLVALLLLQMRMLSSVDSIQTFDPFTILNVPKEATKFEIHRAFRKLSSQYHPDLYPNDPEASTKYQLIVKAYETLTKPELWELFLKYKHPDGPGATKFMIGLPKWLIKKENELIVLLSFFIVLLIIVPSIFLYYYRKQKKFASNGVRIETLQFMFKFITDGIRLRRAPELYASSTESIEMTLNESDNADIAKVIRHIEDCRMGMWSYKTIVRNYLLIMAHLQRLHKQLSPKLTKALNELLEKSNPITTNMIEIAIFKNFYMTAKAMIDFKRSLIQAIDFDQQSLLQIPHYDVSILKSQSKNKKGKSIVKTLDVFLEQSIEERKGMKYMNSKQLEDVCKFCECVSNITLEATIGVVDEDSIVLGDIATCNIKITRVNLKEDEFMGPVHAPYFPFLKFEEWWLFLTDQSGNILAHTVTKSLEQTIEETIQFQVTHIGKNVLTVEAICDSYLGLDKSQTIEFTAFQNDKNRKFYVHPDDAKLENEPTLFQQIMGEALANQSSDDERDDEEEVDDEETNDSDQNNDKDTHTQDNDTHTQDKDTHTQDKSYNDTQADDTSFNESH